MHTHKPAILGCHLEMHHYASQTYFGIYCRPTQC